MIESGGASFDEVFDLEYPRLVRALTVVAGDREAAADAVQDAFVQAHVHWRRVQHYDDPAGWVRRAALNRLANQRRGNRRRERFVSRSTEAARHDGPTGPGSEQVATHLDLAAAVRALPAGQRAAVALHYLAQLSVAEVAATLGIAPGTVKSQLHDARVALARHPALSREEVPDAS